MMKVVKISGEQFIRLAPSYVQNHFGTYVELTKSRCANI